MWAMLLSLAVTVPLIIFLFFCTMLLVAVMIFCTYRNRMNVLWWVIATVILGYYVLIPYVIVRAIESLKRCPGCKTLVNRTHRNVCPNCCSRVKQINDKRIAQISILVFIIGGYASHILEELVPALTGS